MKKIAKQKGDISIYGSSHRDGITFSAVQRLDDVIQLTGPKIRSTEAGTRPLSNNDEKELNYWRQKQEKKIKIFSNVMIVLSIMCLPVFFVALCTKNEFMACISKWIFVIATGITLTSHSTGYFFFYIVGDKNMASIRRFNGAKHAVINAFYDLGRTPTLEEVRKYSRFSSECDYLKEEACWFGGIIIISIATFFSGKTYFILLVVLTVIFRYLNKMDKLYFMEFLTVGIPTDYEYEIAINGIKEALSQLRENGISEITNLPYVISEISFSYFDEESEER